MAKIPPADTPIIDRQSGRISLEWYTALQRLVNEVVALGSGGVVTFEGRNGAVVSASGDYTASEITNVAAGDIVAVTVQAALDELDGEKVANTRQVISGAGLTGGGDLSADRTLAVGAGTGITVNADDVALDTASTRNTDHSGVTLTAGAGLTGGGDISASRSFAVGAGTGITVNADDVALDTASTRNTDHSGVTLTAGAGLTGGGDISASRSFAVGAGTGITVNADDVELNITGLTAETSPATGDEIPLEDVSVPAKRKMTLADMLSVVASLGDVTSFGSGDKILVIEGGTAKKADYDNLPGAAGAGLTAVALQAFDASGTYTPTSGMEYCLVISTGGGGGGGGADSTDGSSAVGAGGGGAGATCIELFSAATIGASQTVTIGAAGTAGANTGGNGGNGGDTTFGALHTAGGGTGGTGLASGGINNAVTGGAGGTASGGLVNISGEGGGGGIAVSNAASVVLGGKGGSSFWGGGGRPLAVIGASSNGSTAVGFGGGGSGAVNCDNTAGNTGGAGVAGFCLVLEFV